MSLSNYLLQSREHCAELLHSLNPEEVNRLREYCRKMGRKAWYSWYDENMNEIQQYVSATPSERKKKKTWNTAERRPLLVLGACTHAFQAYILLHALCDTPIVPGGPYRTMTASAGSVYLDVLAQDLPDWPFEDPNPFAE